MRVTETIVTTVTSTITYFPESEGDDSAFSVDHGVSVNAEDCGLATASRELLWALVEGQGKTLAKTAKKARKGEVGLAITTAGDDQ